MPFHIPISNGQWLLQCRRTCDPRCGLRCSPEVTDEKSEAYRAGYRNICEIGKERIRRAGAKIAAEAGEKAAGLDLGFRCLRLDTSNMTEVYYAPDAVTQDGFSRGWTMSRRIARRRICSFRRCSISASCSRSRLRWRRSQGNASLMSRTGFSSRVSTVM